MAFGEPHTHFIHFEHCDHKDPKYVFLPDPKNSARCICSRADHFKITMAGRSEKVKYMQQIRLIPASCDDCSLRPKLTLDEYTRYLSYLGVDGDGDENMVGVEDAVSEESPSKKPRI
ncbi:hypothetical protein TWF281_003589 [Arthrobotrys megalospora]